MPFKNHPVFSPPENKDQKIWRYMDFTKFMYLLENQELYFSSLETLAKLDPFEGSLAKGNVDFRNLTFDEYKSAGGTGFPNKEIFDSYKKLSPQMGAYQKHMRKTTYVNCWHINTYESAAMWTTYLKSNDGIAITTTYERLIKSLSSSPETIYRKS